MIVAIEKFTQKSICELTINPCCYDLFDCIEPKWDDFFIGVNSAAESDDDLVKINNLSAFLLYISTKCSGSY